MYFRYEIDSENEAFEFSPIYELQTMLTRFALQVLPTIPDHGGSDGYVYDVNGSEVGSWSFTPPKTTNEQGM